MSAKKNVSPMPLETEWVTPKFHESAEYQLSLLRAFDLPPICREVVVLRELHGHEVAEIAARLGISRAAVEKRLRRAERWRASRRDEHSS
jgi:DNA-directed RNA polymerase specialized sigma24 family protein